MLANYQLDSSLDSYISRLKQYGVQPSSKLTPAFFQLRNGLSYPGLLAREEVSGNEELVRIPIELLLTAHRAREEPALAAVFDNRFYKEGAMWQDRVLVTFLLYLLSTNKDCIWLHMAHQFSKDIDIVSFWDEQEFFPFVDRSVRKAAQKERSHFEAEWLRF
jgi:hypothetical protein